MSSHNKEKSKSLISWQRHWMNGLVCNYPKFWKTLGDFESKVLEFDLEEIKINQPVYVCGLARSGSTILLEILAEQPTFTAHKYSDFPFVFTPYLWRMIQKIMSLGRLQGKSEKKQERFHGDGLLISSNSPEAMEEVLWMHFFTQSHDTLHSAALGADLDEAHLVKDGVTKPGFTAFYTDHIKKLLLASKAPRYLAKANYNITRIEYILNMLPSAKFIVPVRAPEAHVESLLRQHQNFLQQTKGQKRALKHLSRVGHFEFGADLRPICLENDAAYQNILTLFEAGELLRGYARYWAYIYGYVYRQYKTNSSVYCYKYEDFCENTSAILREVTDFINLPCDQDMLEKWSDKVAAPRYYESQLSAGDKAIIEEETAAVAALWGYKL